MGRRLGRTAAEAEGRALAAARESADRLRAEARNYARLIIEEARAEAIRIRRTAEPRAMANAIDSAQRDAERSLARLTALVASLTRGGAEVRRDAGLGPVVKPPPVARRRALSLRAVAYWTLVVAVSLAIVVALIFLLESQDVSSLEP